MNERRAWQHFAADYESVRSSVLNDPDLLATFLRQSLYLSNECRWLCHRFDPHGVSVLAMTNTMRVALHTWPERRRATVDVWTSDFDATSALEFCGRLLTGTQSPQSVSS